MYALHFPRKQLQAAADAHAVTVGLRRTDRSDQRQPIHLNTFESNSDIRCSKKICLPASEVRTHHNNGTIAPLKVFGLIDMPL